MMLDLVGILPPWVGDAACGSADVDPEIFFPHPGKNGERDTADVRRFCRRCPVVNACAEYAIANEIEHGIWGGLTDLTRRRLTGRQGNRSLRTVPCKRCGSPATGGKTSAFCSEACRRDHHREYSREYQRAQRSAS